jgi:flagellar basal body-associated protein FliL
MSTQEEAPKKKKPSMLMAIIKPLAIVSVLVVVEIVAATMLIPSAEATEELAKELAKAAHGEEEVAAEHEEHAAHDEHVETAEVELLSDNLTRFNPDTDSTLNIQFAVFGVVLAEEKVDFEHHFKAHSGRIHEQIMLTLHAAESGDLSSAGLGLIKRQILEKTNRTLGKPMLREVVFTKLNFIER